jgi:DNA repair exonuclease SbcCD ATPase subunit
MPATVLAELARLQHAEAGTHAKFVDMREQAQSLQNQLQKLQRNHGMEAKARKLLDKSLQAANRQNEELKKQLKAAQKAGASTSTQSDKSKNQLAQYATGLEKQLGYVQQRNKDLTDEVKRRNAEVKAASQQTLTLSKSTEELSVGLTESSAALAAEQKLRKSYEAKAAALEKETRKNSRRLEEQLRKNAEAATSFSSELQQAQKEAATLKEAVKLEQREAGRSKRAEVNQAGAGRQAQKHAAEYRAEAEELRRTLADTEAQRDAEAQLRYETMRKSSQWQQSEERSAGQLEAEQKARRISEIQLHASQKRVKELEQELRRLSASGAGDLSILLSTAPSSRRTSLASLGPIRDRDSSVGGGDQESEYDDEDFESAIDDDDDSELARSVLGASAGARARGDTLRRQQRKKERDARNRYAPRRASRKASRGSRSEQREPRASRSSLGSIGSAKTGGTLSPTAAGRAPRGGGNRSPKSPKNAPPDSDSDGEANEEERRITEIESSTAMKVRALTRSHALLRCVHRTLLLASTPHRDLRCVCCALSLPCGARCSLHDTSGKSLTSSLLLLLLLLL